MTLIQKSLTLPPRRHVSKPGFRLPPHNSYHPAPSILNRMPYISKHIFLNTLTCPTLGWRLENGKVRKEHPLSPVLDGAGERDFADWHGNCTPTGYLSMRRIRGPLLRSEPGTSSQIPGSRYYSRPPSFRGIMWQKPISSYGTVIPGTWSR